MEGLSAADVDLIFNPGAFPFSSVASPYRQPPATPTAGTNNDDASDADPTLTVEAGGHRDAPPIIPNIEQRQELRVQTDMTSVVLSAFYDDYYTMEGALHIERGRSRTDTSFRYNLHIRDQTSRLEGVREYSNATSIRDRDTSSCFFCTAHVISIII